MVGIKRHIEVRIKKLLQHFPAVVVLGVRQCGKTYLAKKLRPSWQYFDLENSKDKDFITRDFDFFFQEYPKHIILDEAQEVPEMFKNLRGVIDKNRKLNNRFLITGSSSPELIAHVSNSLAGRVGIVELGTFKMSEIKKQNLSSFFKIFNTRLQKKDLNFLLNNLKENKNFDILSLIQKGGYPDPCLSRKKDYFKLWMQNYFDSYINRDIRKLYPRLDIHRFQRFIAMLSELSGTLINKAQVGRALDLSEVSIKDYLDIVDKTFIWRQVPAFSYSKRKSILKMPKGFLRDSGLINYLMNIESKKALMRSPKLGQIFESYAIEETIKGLNSSFLGQWNYFYYRTRNGAEVDLILKGDFGILPIEIKFSSMIKHKSLTSLKAFIEEHSLPYGVVISNSKEVKMLTKNIIQIPLSSI